MCGIVAYSGRKRAAPLLLEGLQKLEYRGYDSAGIALLDGGRFTVVKKKGRVKELSSADSLGGTLGIGHTRWATHGAPSERNAHPHVYGRFAIVHNGIIENYLALKAELSEDNFSSDTDSEVIAHLLERCYRGDLLAALREVCARLTGSYALAVLCSDFPDTVALAREKSPLVVGIGEEGVFAASDIPAVAGEGVKIYPLSDGEFALLRGERAIFYDRNLRRLRKESAFFDCSGEIPDRKGFPHFMAKEMSEIPAAVAGSVVDFMKTAHYSEFCEVLRQTEYIHIVACGTAYHSGIAAKYILEELARVPVEVSIASEFRYRNPILPNRSLVIAVSQSGETADTLAAARLGRELGAKVAAVTNAPFSSLTQIADFVLETRAGREIAVAATKSFNAQLALLFSIAYALADMRGHKVLFSDLAALPALCERTRELSGEVERWTPFFRDARSVYFIGRGEDYCAALEGSLKLKEISYLPGEGYPAGELKHGTLALVDETTPVVAIVTREELADKTMNAVHEVAARGARVFLITALPSLVPCREVTASLVIPSCAKGCSTVLSVIPLQALAYHTALARGNDPDKPRNLAKSVTVE